MGKFVLSSTYSQWRESNDMDYYVQHVVTLLENYLPQTWLLFVLSTVQRYCITKQTVACVKVWAALTIHLAS